MKNEVGNRYGKLVVIAYDHSNDGAFWKCQCDCGMTTVVSGASLRRGHTHSCGCIAHETQFQRIHGESHDRKTRLYNIWVHMRNRCNNPNREAYKWYGGRGIKVCEEWNSYSEFKKWAMSHGYTDDMTIDRIDTNLGYCPGNCRWLTRSDNSKHRQGTYKPIRGEGDPKVRQPQRIGDEKI